MVGVRTHRLVFAALTVAFAGMLAIPVKLLPSGGQTRVAVGVGPSTIGTHPSTSLPSLPPAPPPTPRREHPIQAPEPAPGSDGPAGPGSDAVSSAPVTVAPESLFHDRTPIQRAPTTDAAKTVYGVVIGINDYPGTASDLQGAVPDAEDMSDALAMNGVPAANVSLLLDDAASTQGIIEALRWVVSSTTPDSTVVLFYAGHVRKIGPDTEAIVAADGGVLPDWYIAKQIEGLPAHDVWIVMASCFGGGFTELMAPGRILTAAADANSLAYENESFGRSYLDEYLIHQALLEGGSGPTAQQAFAYAQAGLQRDYPDRTLTEIDQSTEAISLDGVHRATPPPGPGTGSGGSGGAGPGGGDPPPTVPPAPPSTPPEPPPPCHNVLGLFCPPGSR